jgi:hypothetical protein
MFSKKIKMAAVIKKSILPAILDFLENFSYTKSASLTNLMQKTDRKILSTSRVMLQKLVSIRHLGSIDHFWLI